MTSSTITCDRSHTNYDLCSINGTCSLDQRTGTLALMDTAFSASAPIVEKIRPYPRKEDKWVMPTIEELTLRAPLSVSFKRLLAAD
ncbi:hypothetical protein DY000_02019710 [Brassica cretica]|uniref:Uncharacterized protein n=1 Tax=Brassica cretica TaxID=69181 RepID=A0ABQ7CNA8_BRACR|nr:hypothetical protein DY000_02019710 [Brassica cretica]